MTSLKINRRSVKRYVLQVIVVILGSLLLAFGNIVFLSPQSINAGGLNGIAIIIMSFFAVDVQTLVYNIVIDALSVSLWIVGLIFIGKDFAFKTLLSTILVPLATAFFSFVPGISDWCKTITGALYSSDPVETGEIILGGITGGVIVGFGVAITFVGGGSSGGVDVLTFILDKYLHIKQSIGSFLVDGTIIIVGLAIMFPMNNSILVNCLVGIISAFLTSLLIEFVYVGTQTSYQVDIISDKWKEISAYAQDVLGRGATIMRVEGGYKGEERVILRVVFDKRQYTRIRDFITKTDPNAFVTFTQTNAVYGEGFKKARPDPIKKKK